MSVCDAESCRKQTRKATATTVVTNPLGLCSGCACYPSEGLHDLDTAPQMSCPVSQPAHSFSCTKSGTPGQAGESEVTAHQLSTLHNTTQHQYVKPLLQQGAHPVSCTRQCVLDAGSSGKPALKQYTVHTHTTGRGRCTSTASANTPNSTTQHNSLVHSMYFIHSHTLALAARQLVLGGQANPLKQANTL